MTPFLGRLASGDWHRLFARVSTACARPSTRPLANAMPLSYPRRGGGSSLLGPASRGAGQPQGRPAIVRDGQGARRDRTGPAVRVLSGEPARQGDVDGQMAAVNSPLTSKFSSSPKMA
jgi:hypothetical protein